MWLSTKKELLLAYLTCDRCIYASVLPNEQPIGILISMSNQ